MAAPQLSSRCSDLKYYYGGGLVLLRAKKAEENGKNTRANFVNVVVVVDLAKCK